MDDHVEEIEVDPSPTLEEDEDDQDVDVDAEDAMSAGEDAAAAAAPSFRDSSGRRRSSVARPSRKKPHQQHQQRRTRHASSGARTRSVVKLTVTRVSRSYCEPWRRAPQSSGSGTGFLVAGRRIVTNAHVVKRATTVRARASFSPIMVSCEVEWMSLPLDLAVLRVLDEDTFFQEVAGDGAAANRSENGMSSYLTLCTDLPRLDENVTCVGFPQGGTQISVTRGVVSRIDIGSNDIIRIQIDAAINPGNSGGPVFDEHGRVVGVASSHLRGAGNIGYIIPGQVVDHFLTMCADGLEANLEERSALGLMSGRGMGDVEAHEPRMVPGVAKLGILGSQNLESKALRRSLGLTESGIDGGVRIIGVRHARGNNDVDNGDARNFAEDKTVILTDDVLLSVDGTKIGQDGTVQLSEDRPDERISYYRKITCHRVGTTVRLDILRQKKPMTLDFTLNSNKYLVPKYDGFDAHPSYVVCGGCVFVPLSSPWMSEKVGGKKKSSSSAMSAVSCFNAFSSTQRSGSEQIVVLSKVLADEVNVGYHNLAYLVLRSVNGHEPSNLQDLVKILARNAKGPNLEFRFSYVNHEDAEYVICMDMDEVCEAERRIMSRHMIATWCSADAVPVDFRNEVEGADGDPCHTDYWKTMCSLRDVAAKQMAEADTMER